MTLKERIIVRFSIITFYKWYKTPFEVFAQMTGEDCFLNGSVALMG